MAWAVPAEQGGLGGWGAGGLRHAYLHALTVGGSGRQHFTPLPPPHAAVVQLHNERLQTAFKRKATCPHHPRAATPSAAHASWLMTRSATPRPRTYLLSPASACTAVMIHMLLTVPMTATDQQSPAYPFPQVPEAEAAAAARAAAKQQAAQAAAAGEGEQEAAQEEEEEAPRQKEAMLAT